MPILSFTQEISTTIHIVKKQMLRNNTDESRDEDPGLTKESDPGLCTSNEGRFLKVFKQIL